MKGVNPSLAENQHVVSQFAKFERLSASPGAYKAIALLNMPIDVRAILPTETCDRLSQVKRSWDPEGRILANHSIALAAA